MQTVNLTISQQNYFFQNYFTASLNWPAHSEIMLGECRIMQGFVSENQTLALMAIYKESEV